MRLVLAMLLQHEQNNLKTDVAPFTIYTPMFKAVVKQIRYCCRLWPKNCCKSRDFFYLLQQNLYILYILRARRAWVQTPARPPTTVITLTGEIMLAVIRNRAPLHADTWSHLSGSSGIYSHNGFKWGQLAQFTLILLTAVFLFIDNGDWTTCIWNNFCSRLNNDLEVVITKMYLEVSITICVKCTCHCVEVLAHTIIQS